MTFIDFIRALSWWQTFLFLISSILIMPMISAIILFPLTSRIDKLIKVLQNKNPDL